MTAKKNTRQTVTQIAGAAPCDHCSHYYRCKHLHLACTDYGHYLSTGNVKITQRILHPMARVEDSNTRIDVTEKAA